MPDINKMFLKQEGFWCDTSIDLNTGYYHTQLSENESNLCTINIPWVKDHYKRLPMVIANLPDIYQHKMSDLFHGFEFIRAYIQDISILTKGYWTNHVQKLESILKN